MTKRFIITDAARAEVAAIHGEGFAFSVLAIADQSRSHTTYGVVCEGGISGPFVSLFSDQVQEVR